MDNTPPKKVTASVGKSKKRKQSEGGPEDAPKAAAKSAKRKTLAGSASPPRPSPARQLAVGQGTTGRQASHSRDHQALPLTKLHSHKDYSESGEKETQEPSLSVGHFCASSHQGKLTEDLKLMMYGFGDSWEPLPETVALVEELVIDFIRNTTTGIIDVSQIRGRFDLDSFFFLLRHDQVKLRRAIDVFAAYKKVREATKNGFDPEREESFM